jgi:hypothetical protein
MEEYISKLNLERDYNEMINLLTDQEGFKTVKEQYPNFNTKILLSSFLIKNFRDYFMINEYDEVYRDAKAIVDTVINHQQVQQQDFDNFFNSFSAWRDEDIRGMRQEINSAQANLQNMLMDDPQDDADEQWNQGLQINMNIMKTTDSLLKKYGESPPLH